jgi:choline monooxygenase
MQGNYQLPAHCLSDLRSTPIETGHTLHADWYHAESIASLERKHLFDKSWQYAGPESFISEPGSFCPIDVHGKPILLVKELNGDVRAFYNICRHRGGPIATRAGKARMLRCQYHGWSYKHSGELVGTPSFDGVKEFDPKCFGLKSVGLVNWRGLLFVQLDASGPSFESFFGDVATRPDTPCDIAQLKFFRRDVYRVKANWKLYVDNFLEGYHVGMVHPELATVLDTSNYVSETSRNWSLQHAPLQNRPNPYTQGSGAAHYYFVCPNFMLNMVPGRLQVNSVVPRGVHECDVVFDYFYEELSPADLESKAKTDRDFSDLVQKQDIDICEAVQLALNSGGYERGRYSVSEEKSLHHFHEWYRAAISKIT